MTPINESEAYTELHDLVDRVLKEHPDTASAPNLLAEAVVRSMRMMNDIDARLLALEHRGERGAML